MLNNYPMLETGKPAKLGSYAGFPGTGRKGSPIYPGTSACRYFEARRPFNVGS